MLRNARREAIQLEARVSRLWFEYTALRDKAEKSRDLRDGVAAGRAWALFLNEFFPPKVSEGGGS